MKITYKVLRDMIREAVGETPHSFLLERPELLDEKSIMKNKHPFKAVFMFGPAGAGKGYMLKNVFKSPKGKTGELVQMLKGFETANPDDRIEDVFPTFGISMKFANTAEGGDKDLEALQQKSREILQNAARAHTANLLSIANPMIFDTTGEKVGKMVGRIKQLTKIGYEVAVMIINVPTEASVERDQKRDRTVGKTRTTGISQKFKQGVVDLKKYHGALAGVAGVTMLVDEPFNNIFDLSTGKLLQQPTPITPEMLKDTPELDPEKNPEAFEIEKAKIEDAKSRLQKFVSTPVANPAGVKLLTGMKTLVKKSGGRLGQNMNDLVVALANPELAADPKIYAAAEHLSALGGVSAKLRKKKGGKGAEVGAGASEDAPFIQQAIRGKKPSGDQSIRQMTGKKGKRYKPPSQVSQSKQAKGSMPAADWSAKQKGPLRESIDHDKLVEIVRSVLLGKDF